MWCRPIRFAIIELFVFLVVREHGDVGKYINKDHLAWRRASGGEMHLSYLRYLTIVRRKKDVNDGRQGKSHFEMRLSRNRIATEIQYNGWHL